MQKDQWKEQCKGQIPNIEKVNIEKKEQTKEISEKRLKDINVGWCDIQQEQMELKVA